MPRCSPALLAVAAMCLSGVLTALAAAQDPTRADFYVAGDGNDSWSGKLPAPNAEKTDGPFATWKRAREAVRVVRSAQESSWKSSSGIRVLLRGGVYPRAEPLVFRPEDSGKPFSPTIYESFPGERAEVTAPRGTAGQTGRGAAR